MLMIVDVVPVPDYPPNADLGRQPSLGDSMDQAF